MTSYILSKLLKNVLFSITTPRCSHFPPVCVWIPILSNVATGSSKRKLSLSKVSAQLRSHNRPPTRTSKTYLYGIQINYYRIRNNKQLVKQ
jgi:hypothetical protein